MIEVIIIAILISYSDKIISIRIVLYICLLFMICSKVHQEEYKNQMNYRIVTYPYFEP